MVRRAAWALLSWVCGALAMADREEETNLLQMKSQIYDSNFVSIMLPESRPLSSLPLVVLHAHAHFPELKIQLMHSALNEDFVNSQPVLGALRQKGALVLTALPAPYYFMEPLVRSEYSKMLESQAFWQSALTRKVLLIQADTWLCNGAHDRLRDFLQYDYVGAPFHLNNMETEEDNLKCEGAGNGGLTLRDSLAMLRVIAIQANKSKEDFQLKDEDRFFCAQSDVIAVAPRAVSMEFARNQNLSDEANYSGSIDRILGVHQLVGEIPAAYKMKDVSPTFEAHCPGVSLMLESGTAASSAFADLLIQGWQDKVLPQLTILPTDLNNMFLQTLRLLGGGS